MTGTDLGLYSITFNNDLDSDCASLEAFCRLPRGRGALWLQVLLRSVQSECRLRHCIRKLRPFYVNDCIMRCLAAVTKADRPQFLKIPFNGPKALDELVSYDPSVIVGVLGGGAGTTRDCFELLHQAEKYGARVALFGRKINLAEDPLAMVSFMRQVVRRQYCAL